MPQISEMTIDEYDTILELWKVSEGIIVDEMDDKEDIQRYLNRNPNLSFVAKIDDKMVGTILCGHDGRRGLIRHLAVSKSHRKKGIADLLISKSLESLRKQNISKCNAFVLKENKEGQDFWKKVGWDLLDRDFQIMQTKT